jgi:hypothetical protein
MRGQNSECADRAVAARGAISDTIVSASGYEAGVLVLISYGKDHDRSFPKKWIVAAPSADKLFEAIRFDAAVERLEDFYRLSFESSAKDLLNMFDGNHTVLVDVSSYLGEVMSMMAQMGFLVLNGLMYDLSIPVGLNKSRVRNAAMKPAATIDNGCMLHQEDPFRTFGPSYLLQCG